MTPDQDPPEFTPAAAADRLRQHLAGVPDLDDATLARVPDLDIDGLYAFSILSQLTGRAGEALYLVDPTTILSSARGADFDRLMARLGAGRAATPLDAHAFARLFLRLRAQRRGVALDRPDGHVLLAPGQVPPERFIPPQAEPVPTGVRYRFWAFDADRLEPEFWDVVVAPDGATTFAHSSASSA